jgi:hypothetical protein
MSDLASCTACAFVRRQLGARTWCPFHAGLGHAPAWEVPETACCVLTQPSADAPWPFTSREYARLLLLRSRMQARRDALQSGHFEEPTR